MNSVIWKTVKIKDIAEINPDSISPKTPKETLINYIDLESVKKGKILGIKKMLFSDAPSRAKRVVKNGDVLFSTVRPYQKNFTIIENEQDNLIASTGFAVLRAKEDNDPRFIYQMLYSDVFMNQIISEMKGSNYPAVNASDVEKVEILLPSLKEQQKIASILSTVDEQIDETEQLIVKTKELKKGLMQQLLTKGIGHTEFKRTELGEIPIDWDIMKLSEISEFITKGSTPTTYGFDWEDEGIYFFKSDVVKEGKFVYGDYKYISKEAHKQMTRSIVKAGDILISITGNVGRVAIVPQEIEEANINQHIARIRVNRENVNAQFIFQWLNQSKIIKYYELIKTGLAYPQISLAQVRDTLIPIPSSNEQQKIASILSTVDEQIEAYEQEKAKYEELKKGLMQQLLIGKIRVKI